MKIKHIQALVLLALLLSAGASSAGAQTPQTTETGTAATTPTTSQAKAGPAASGAGAGPIIITATTSPMDLARAALAAQGGEKYRNVKNIVLIGTVDLYAPNSAQSVTGNFAMVMASGDRYRMDVISPIVKFQQIFNGQQSYSSIPSIQIPNPSKYGLNLLTKFDQPGYVVSALPDKKKQRAFRITDPDGNLTDFFVDTQTGRVMVYTMPINGHTLGMEIKSVKDIDGVIVPINFTQRFETRQGAYFAEYRVKTPKVNEIIGDDLFVIPGQ
jgi:guanyl-specific ribonuclease Sa